jgi:excinuclease ABC subunit C
MQGVENLKSFVVNAPTNPGVYRMIDKSDKILYIGKAKNLKNRLTQYTQINNLTNRIARMVFNIARLEVTTTRTETEALLLEARLIKENKPPYNIMLRDDKSFPYIAFDENTDYPRIYKHRGKKQKGVSYFGPYPSPTSVNIAISTLQRAFLLRPCADSYFENRKKPCMEYQIKRCSAPCMNYISQDDYKILMKQAKDFLNGRSQEVKKSLQEKMMQASDAMEYEKAAVYRNRIAALSHVQSKQSIYFNNIDEADVIAVAIINNKVCIQIFFVRGGNILGNTEYFPSNTEDMTESDILEFFIMNFYENKPLGKDILISHELVGKELIENALYETSGKKVEIFCPQKGEKRQIVEMALENAKNSIERKFAEEERSGIILAKIKEVFGIKRDITRIEVFDNSHIFGDSAIGAMIVAGFDEENKWGLLKKHYRRFNVDAGEKKTGGDDFDMMRQVMRRRYGRIKNEGTKFPELVILDGGAGQLSSAMQIFKELEIENEFDVIAIAKGPDRNASNEDFYQVGSTPFKLQKNDSILYFIQNLRDEVHRFAITGHRAKKVKSLIRSKLDEIPEIGPKRKKALLNHFGSATLVENASLEELIKVEGINQLTAEKVYNYFRDTI